MKFRTTLLVCLPLLTVVSCKGKSSKKAVPTATIPIVNTAAKSDSTPKTPEVPALPVVTVPVLPGTEAGNTSQNQNTPAGGVTVPIATPADGATPATEAPKADPLPECETLVLDFDKKPDGTAFGKGEKLKDQYAAYGIAISSQKRLGRHKDFVLSEVVEPVIFDTAERPSNSRQERLRKADCEFGDCKGFDFDLLTDTNGKAMIIAEYMFDRNPRDSVDAVTFPDDNGRGGVLMMTFAKPTSLISMDLIGHDAKNSNIELFTKAEDGTFSKTSEQALPEAASAAVNVTTMSIDDHSYINKLMIKLSGSGAVDNLKICIKK